MQWICDAPGGKTWFRIETEAEAIQEAALMRHAIEKHFRQAAEAAAKTFKPTSRVLFEQEIGLKAHIQRTMPLFLTLRDPDGAALVTAMLPPDGGERPGFTPIIVGPGNSDPFPRHGESIRALGMHFGIDLDPERCYPYRRG